MKQSNNFRLNLNEHIRIRMIHEHKQKGDRRILKAQAALLAIQHVPNGRNKLLHIIVIRILLDDSRQTHNGLFPYVYRGFV